MSHTTPARDAQVQRAAKLLSSGEVNSIRQAAGRVGLSESTLRYHLNGRKRSSGRGTADPAPDPEQDQLANAPTSLLPVIERRYAGVDALRIYALGDVHLGARQHEAEKWQEWLDYVRGQDDVSVILTGDLFNSAIKGSLSETYDEMMTVGDAMKVMRQQLEPIANKIDLAIPGNHEERVYRAVGIEPVEVVADALGIPYARKVAILHYTFEDAEYSVYVRHGTGMDGAGTIGGKANAMERASKAVVADIYLSGHTHAQVLARDRVFEPLPSPGYWRRRLFVSAGSFVGYEDYAAERAWVAGDIGAPRIRLDGTRKDAHASL